jgi:elongation factor P--beta-lysine ligase
MDFKSYFIHEWTIQAIRNFFIDRNFHEVDTPTLLAKSTIEPNLYPLQTKWTQKNFTFYLPTSPESSLKKVIAEGIGNCFAVSKVFRDLEDIGPTHNLEFSMVEWYEMGKTHHDIAITTKNLILDIYHQVQQKLNLPITDILTYQGNQIDLGGDWYQFTLQELFQKYANIDLSKNLTTSEIIATAKAKGYNVDGVTSWEPLYTQIFINEIESKIPQDKPFIIFDYPTQTSPLCQLCPDSPGFSQRFEFYIGGMEIGNAYTESTDSQLLKDNFEAETKFREENHLPVYPYDQEFIDACGKLPPCAGIGVGVDRLAMLLADTDQIEDILYFPTSKFLKGQK